MKKSLYIGTIVLSAFITRAQDLHFTQTAQTPLLINPAAAGVYDGWERVIINHRNQWLGASTQFMTTNISADINLFKSPRNDKAHMGVGLMFYNDIGGDSQYGQRAGAVTVSGIIPMGGTGHILSAGIQAGMGNRSGNTNALTYRSQWDGQKFDQLILSGEQNKLMSFNYLDASAGLYYVFDGSQSSFQRKKEFKLQIGVSGYHLNAPEFKFSNGTSGERLMRKYVGHIGVTSDIGTSRMAIDANAIQTIQGPHYQTLFGLMMKYRFEDNTMITGHTQKAYVGIGLYTRLKDAIMPSVLIDWRGFQFGISYDVTLSALRNAYKGGSLEFSLSYVNRSHALFKTRRARF